MNKRILTGDRPTGRLHLGHYIGSLQNRIRLQHSHQTLILIADIQALTTHFERPSLINKSIYQVAIDNLAVGLDPNKVVFIQQSQVKAIAELTVLYSMLISVNTLRHNPTIKAEAMQYGYDDLTYGFLGYPVSQAADITFCKADLVPVGEDQKPHIEVARKLVRRFNDLYNTNVLTLPEMLLSDCPRLVGIDGNNKMGKSLNNAIYLDDEKQIVQEKIRRAKTDPGRIHPSDPGSPDVCVISQYHKAFNCSEYQNICELCKKGAIGCVACKKQLADLINDLLDPIRERESYYKARLNEVRSIISAGTHYANEIGDETINEIKDAMHILL